MKKLTDPKIVIPLIFISVLPLVIILFGRPGVTIGTGTWLYERQNGIFRPVWRAPRALTGTMRARRGGYRKVSLKDPDLSLWAAAYSLRTKKQFPSALLEDVREKTPDIRNAPFLMKGRSGTIYLLPWLYPAFFLFVALFLLKNGWAKTVSAILIGAFLFLYALQTVSTGTRPARTGIHTRRL